MKKKEIYDKSWHGFIHNNILGRYVDSYLPYYDDYADYNTNAKSYYDYLARYNHLLKLYAELINRLLRRNLEVLETDTLELLKKGDWLDNGTCPPNNFDDIIKLLGNVKISNKVNNAIEINKDGLFVDDLSSIIKDLEESIKDLDNSDLWDKIKDLEDAINSIQGINLKQLMLNRDYKIHFFNGFYSPSNDLVLSVGETSEILDLHITTHSTSGRILKHDGDLRDTRQSLRPDKDIPEESKVFSIEFLGDYSYLNNKEVYFQNTIPNVWHIIPSTERASWAVGLTPHNIENMINFSWRNFSDGYSRQLKDTYTEELKLTYGMVDSKITFKK